MLKTTESERSNTQPLKSSEQPHLFQYLSPCELACDSQNNDQSPSTTAIIFDPN